MVAAQQQNSTTCVFADGKGVRVNYTPVSAAKPLTEGKPWSPDNQPMLLFTEVPTQIAGTNIPVGAYSVYLIPGAKEWTLVINRDVNSTDKYKKSADLLRAPMQVGMLPSKADEFIAYLGLLSPGQCSMRFDYGQTRAWIVLNEAK